MSNLRRYIAQDLMSFGILALIFCILELCGVLTEVRADALLILFVMTTCIAAAMFFVDKLPFKRVGAVVAVHLALICGIVFGIGVPIGFIPAEPDQILIVLGMICAVYFSVFGLMFLRTQSDANKINSQLEFLRLKLDKKENSGTAEK